MKKELIEDIFGRFHKYQPKPEPELYYRNPYTLLVAVMLSAQATDKGVNKVTRELFKLISKPEDTLKLGENKLKSYIKSIGLFNTKAKNIMAMSQILTESYKSEVPDSLEELSSLPGVGRKTANVVLNIAFNKPVIAVDTHVFRVSNRIGLVNTRTPESTEKALEKIIPDKYKHNAHHWLILHGRYICKARKPLCSKCLIADICEYPDKG